MKKDIEYYLNLPYTIVVKKDQDNCGDCCYIARVLEIPHVIGDGVTAQEALECLNVHLRLAIDGYLKDGLAVPEPQTAYSGNLNIRVDPRLHGDLAREAAAGDMSLNKYTSLILERRQHYSVAPLIKVRHSIVKKKTKKPQEK
jgi:antitoxin HicB